MNYTNNDLARRIATAFRVLAGYVMIATAATLLQFYESDTLIIVFWTPAAVAATVLTLGRFDSVDIEMTQAHTTIRFRQLTWRGYRRCKIVARNEHIVRADGLGRLPEPDRAHRPRPGTVPHSGPRRREGQSAQAPCDAACQNRTREQT